MFKRFPGTWIAKGINIKEEIKMKNSKQLNKVETLELLRSNFFASLNKANPEM